MRGKINIDQTQRAVNTIAVVIREEWMTKETSASLSMATQAIAPALELLGGLNWALWTVVAIGAIAAINERRIRRLERLSGVKRAHWWRWTPIN